MSSALCSIAFRICAPGVLPAGLPAGLPDCPGLNLGVAMLFNLCYFSVS